MTRQKSWQVLFVSAALLAIVDDSTNAGPNFTLDSHPQLRRKAKPFDDLMVTWRRENRMFDELKWTKVPRIVREFGFWTA